MELYNKSTKKDKTLKFSFPINVSKAREENEKHYVDFVASDTDIDLVSERFTKNAIESMVEYAKSGVELLKTHYEPFAMGKTVDGKIISKGKDSVSGIDIYEFHGTAELDMNYRESQILFEDIKNGVNKRQLSVGGFINWDEDDAVLWEEVEIAVTEQKNITLYILALNKFVLEHIAVTRENGAANPRTGFLSAIMRSIDFNYAKMKGIDCNFDSIDNVIKCGQLKSAYNLGWLKIKTPDKQEKEENEMDKGILEQLRENAKKESQDRLKSMEKEVEEKTSQSEESEDVNEKETEKNQEKEQEKDKNVDVKYEKETEKNQEEEQEKDNIGKAIVDIFSNISKDLGEIKDEISKSKETEDEEVKSESNETEEVKPEKTSDEIDPKEFFDTVKSFEEKISKMADGIKSILELSNNKIKSVDDKLSKTDKNIEDVVKRLGNLEISYKNSRGFVQTDSATKSIENEQDDDLSDLLFGTF